MHVDHKNIEGGTRQQIGALPFTRDNAGRVQVMLVTSRETRRWVIPKGWPMQGKKPHRAAKLEAFEEAGLLGRVGKEPLGSYLYNKRLGTGSTVPCEVLVFPLEVKSRRSRWPEMNERERRWFSPEEAAGAVAEDGLRDLLRRMGQKTDERSKARSA
jgi:8-oxo-dGTP pyrophosphatase MutT (NUDIX family)